MSSPIDLIKKVPASFDTALQSGDLLFFPSTVTKHQDSGIEFEIRLCPALQKKPTSDAAPAEEAKTPDPFAPPYNPNLHIGDLQGEGPEDQYVILLNKYSVVPHHFILATKEFKLQSSPLLPPDLAQTYLVLAAARKARKDFFAFYNCGENSGASQPHRHVQFFPLEDEDGPPVEQLARAVNVESADKPFSLTKLPYANHVYRFPARFSSYTPEKLEETLASAFLSLLDLVVSTIRHDPDYPAGKPSYNVIITWEHMHLIPRRQEAYTLGETGERVSVNALGFAGLLLVKSEEELEAVKKEGVGKILRGVGLESVHDLQVAGTSG